MTAARVLTLAAIAGIGLGAVAWAVQQGIERLAEPGPVADTEAAAPADDTQVPHINATLFFADPSGEYLVPVRREVPLAEAIDDQGRHILTSLAQPAPAPLIGIIPAGTTIRAFYLTERGDAFVDLGSEAATGHPGGSTTEMLTVYAIVNTVTANLPSAKRVQILIDGKEVDTLKGHVDLRRPLEPNARLVKEGER